MCLLDAVVFGSFMSHSAIELQTVLLWPKDIFSTPLHLFQTISDHLRIVFQMSRNVAAYCWASPTVHVESEPQPYTAKANRHVPRLRHIAIVGQHAVRHIPRLRHIAIVGQHAVESAYPVYAT